MHLACRALWSGEIEIAIVGGASVMIDPAVHAILDHAGVISAAGRSRFGDAGADGYVRGEGVAAVILKPLRQAMADGDTIYAAIAGTGVTHNGRSGTGQFAPGVLGQEQMLRAAYQDAGIGPDEVDYIEAHGAGTASGDLVELQALTGVLCPGRAAERPCLVGSVKSNIGHSEATAGLAGLLKAALGIRAGVIPATLHVHQAHPALDASGGRLALPLSTMRWPERDRPRTAGVSAFGASGTNVHIVLTEAAVPRRRGGRHQGPGLLALSARDPLALRNLARDYADLLAEPGPQAQLRDVCFSAGAHRSHHDFRLAVAAPPARPWPRTCGPSHPARFQWLSPGGRGRPANRSRWSSSSLAMVRAGAGQAVSSSRPPRGSLRACETATGRSGRNWAGCPVAGWPTVGRWRMSPTAIRCSGPSRCASRPCGTNGASAPISSWGTAWARSRPPPLPARWTCGTRRPSSADERSFCPLWPGAAPCGLSGLMRTRPGI